MLENYKIVCCTAAGRMRYMQYIFPYVLTSDIVDRYDLWVNTTNMEDIECFKLLAAKYPKINLIWQPDGIVNGVSTINAFYRFCMDADTIYIKIDDDIVWMQPDAIDRMVRFRIDHRDAFLVTPMVVNNPMSSYIWQCKGVLKYANYRRALSGDKMLWKRGAFALELHRYFLGIMEHDSESYRRLHVGTVPEACNRFGINFILWFGSDLAPLKGNIPGDDEEFLSSVMAPRSGRVNYFDGDTLIAHFAFNSQRAVLDRTDILQRYGRLCEQLFAASAPMQQVWQQVQASMQDIAARRSEIAQMACPYPIVRKSLYEQMRQKFKFHQKLNTYRWERLKGIRYTVEEGYIFENVKGR